VDAAPLLEAPEFDRGADAGLVDLEATKASPTSSPRPKNGVSGKREKTLHTAG
jgi:hypothetical protein